MNRPTEAAPALSDGLETPGDFYGWMELPSGRWSIAGRCVIREEFGGQKFDWLDVYLPLAGLAAVDERVGGYPFGDTADCRGSLKPVSARLGQIGCAVVDAAGGAAFVGFEVSGTPEADGWDGAVPAERNIGYVAPNDHGFADYFAPTKWG